MNTSSDIFIRAIKLARTFSKISVAPPNDRIPAVMREIKFEVCLHCGFRFKQADENNQDLLLTPGWIYIKNNDYLRFIGLRIFSDEKNFVPSEKIYCFCNIADGVVFDFTKNELHSLFPLGTPWSHVHESCTAIKIYHDGSWKSEDYPGCRGIWKDCPDQLKPAAGQEFVVHYRPEWMK